jgi:rhodanese-related sulfurtransferase
MSAEPRPIGSVRNVSVAQAAQLQADGTGAVLIDVREPGEFAALRAPGAVLLPLVELPARLAELPRDRDLLLVCRSGGRSLRATMWLMQQGFDNVSNVDGGMNAWRNAGLPTHSGPPEPGEGELPTSAT